MSIKKFIDLESGDPVHLIGVNLSSEIVFTRTVTFDCYIYDEDDSSRDIYDINTVIIKFKEKDESCLRTTLIQEMAAKENISGGTDLFYFPDIQRAEIYLKDLKEKNHNLSEGVDKVYGELWENLENMTTKKSDEKKEYVLGDFLYNNNFKEAGIYIGNNKVMYGDGVITVKLTQIELEKSYRQATEVEIRTFMNKCYDSIKRKTIYVSTINDKMSECGYRFNKETMLFEK